MAPMTVLNMVPAGRVRSVKAFASTSKLGGGDGDGREWLIRNAPGGTGPLGDLWDPLDLSEGKDVNTVKRWREAELQHGRVGMASALGILVGENYPVLDGPAFDDAIPTDIPAIYQFQEVPSPTWELIALGIGLAEAYRASVGWVEPSKASWQLRPTYSPGDIGFDPLGLKPTDSEELRELQNKEINNGRLGMVATAGMVVQELVDGQQILEHLQS